MSSAGAGSAGTASTRTDGPAGPGGGRGCGPGAAHRCSVVCGPVPLGPGGCGSGAWPEPGPPTTRGAVRHPGPLPVIVWSAGADRVHSSLRLLTERVGDGGGAGGLGRGLLTVLADHVPHEGLDQTGLLLFVVGDAADVVAHQDDRVAAGLGGVAGQLDGEVVLAPTLEPLRVLHHRGRGLGRRGHELLADADVRHPQVTGLREVGVPDGAVAAADGADDTRGALGGLAAGDRPVAVGLVGPRPAGRGRQVLGEVLGGARLLGTVHRGDRQVGQGRLGVVRGERRVVPLRDLLVEDAGDDLGGEVELLDSLEVVDHRDRRDVVRQLEDLTTGAALLRGGQLLLVERGVGAGEVGAARDELLAATAGAHRVVVHGHAGLHTRVAGGPALHRGLLAARAGAVEGTAQLRGAAGRLATAAAGGLLVGGAARG